MTVSDLKPGTRVVDLSYPEPRPVWIVDRPVPGRDRPTVECHAEEDPDRRARHWVGSLAPAPAPHPDFPVRAYRWEDLRDTTAGALQPGDVVFSLAAFQVVHVAKDGRISGGSMHLYTTSGGDPRVWDRHAGTDRIARHYGGRAEATDPTAEKLRADAYSRADVLLAVITGQENT